MLKQIIFQTLIVLILSVIAFAQTETVNVPKEQNSAVELYDFSITLNKHQITRGDDIELKVSIKNNDGQSIILNTNRYDEFSPYQFTLKDTNGKEIIQKSDDRASIGSWVGFYIHPLNKQENNLNISKRYDLAAGKYKLTLWTEIYTEYDLKKLRLTSNTIEFEITESSQTETRPQ